MEIVDQLDRGNLLTYLTKSVVTSASSSASRTIAIVGPWGSGKSWLLSEVSPSLGGVTRVFNPWLFSDELGMFQGFAALILERIKDKHARRRIAKILDHVGPSLKGFGFDFSGSIAATSKTLKGMSSPAAIRAAIVKAVGIDPPPSYIVMDDLDRLTPDELLTVFKLLRLVGDLPGIVYVLAYDESTLLRLMMRTSIAFESMERARNYLEKVIETKIYVPPMSEKAKEMLVLEPIIEFGRISQRHFSDKSIEHIAWKVQSLLYPRLNTVRLCERFVSAVESLPPRLYGEIRYVDWLLISFLRTLEPHVFNVIQKHPAVLLGSARHWTTSQEKTKAAAIRVADELTSEASSDLHAAEILDLVDELFSRFAAHRNGRDSTGGASDQRIDSAEYFDLFFAHGLPSESVSDVAVEIALSALSATSDALEGSAALAALLDERPHEVVLAIVRRWQHVTTAEPVFRFLCSVWESPALGYTTGIFQTDGQSEVRNVAETLLSHFSEVELEDLSKELSSATSANSLLVHVIAGIRSPAGSAYFVEWVADVQKILTTVATRLLLSAPTPLRGQPGIAWLLGVLRRLDSPAWKTVIVEWLRSDEVHPSEVLALLLTYRNEFGGGISAVEVDASVRADSDLMELFASAKAGPYPPEWTLSGTFISAVNEDPTPSPEAVANFILDGWESDPAPTLNGSEE